MQALMSIALLATLAVVQSATVVKPATGVQSATLPPPVTVAPGCLYEGQWFAEGSHTVNPCRPCHCYHGHMACAIVDCFYTPCVDPVRDQTKCCPTCPNGQNCRAPDGSIIPSGQDVQINAHTSCRCGPGHFFGSNEATCVVTATLDTTVPPPRH